MTGQAAQRPRILHIITGLGEGGAEGVLARLVTSDGDWDHQVISMMDDGVHGTALRAAGIPVHALGMPRGRLTWSGLMRMRTLVRDIAPNAVQTWMYHADLFGGAMACFAGQRNIVWGIRNASVDPRTTRLPTRLVVRLSALLSRAIPRAIVSCSTRAADLHASLGYDRHRMAVIPNGYDVAHLGPDAEARVRLRAEWNVGAEGILFGMVARWDAQKDHATLIDALARMDAGAAFNWQCVLVGPGMDAGNSDLAALLQRTGISSRVRLMGRRTDIPAIMSALDIHLLSSASEGFPNVVAEAMACGTPCVVTDTGDAALIVGATGWTALPRRADLLSEAIATATGAMKDSVAWQHRREAARERIVQHFDLQRMIAGYHAVWRNGANA